ncbi:MAG: RluA family pseudouridine synthase [Pseudomonadales bacterium]|jgi:23S rRNA pseudouridine955/2504/2580 synthase|tara:strand:+ start:16494 stop:17438 length:945 start_codon:yes stop_codon:yes gene_type:complete
MNVTPAPAVRIVEVDAESDGQRIDNFIAKFLKGVPKSRIYRCLRKGEVRVNGGRVKPSSKLVAGDKVRIPPIRISQTETPTASSGLLDKLYNSIVYEDDRMLVVNKPCGLAVHGGSGISIGVIEGMRQLRPEEKNLELVHRLDRDTSGCLMISKKSSILKKLQSFLVKKDELEKHYQTIVHGRWSKRKQHVDLPLQKNTLSSGERISRVHADGKQSLTRFSVEQQNESFSLLNVQPITGRTHQIRVHCAHLGHPIVGDPKYGAEQLDQSLKPKPGRLMLHAAKLIIPPLQPGDKTTVVVADYDERFLKFIDRIA